MMILVGTWSGQRRTNGITYDSAVSARVALADNDHSLIFEIFWPWDMSTNLAPGSSD
jgi:hypothetical protein